MLQIDGADVMTVAEFAYAKDVKPNTMAMRVKKYADKGGELTAVHQVGNMLFFLVSDLEVMNSATERVAKPKRPTVEQWEEAQRRIAELEAKVAEREAYINSIIEGN